MTLHINKFVDRLRGFESRNARDFNMSMTDAKDLHADITKLLLALQQAREQSKSDEIITLEMTGGSFKS